MKKQVKVKKATSRTFIHKGINTENKSKVKVDDFLRLGNLTKRQKEFSKFFPNNGEPKIVATKNKLKIEIPGYSGFMIPRLWRILQNHFENLAKKKINKWAMRRMNKFSPPVTKKDLLILSDFPLVKLRNKLDELIIK
ncbi:MAG: hypothetical protein AABY22_22685 [Nanoarchaeota archaeon]